MAADRPVRQVDPIGDLPVRHSLGCELRDLELLRVRERTPRSSARMRLDTARGARARKASISAGPQRAECRHGSVEPTSSVQSKNASEDAELVGVVLHEFR
jgi:hypothetical protein